MALRGLIRTAVAAKVIDVVRREASKPENQRKAREFVQRMSDKRRAGKRH